MGREAKQQRAEPQLVRADEYHFAKLQLFVIVYI